MPAGLPERPGGALRYRRPRGVSRAAPCGGVRRLAEVLGRAWAAVACARFPRQAPASASAPAFLRRSGADWRLRHGVRWGRGQALGWAGDEGKQSHVGKGAPCVGGTTFSDFRKGSPPSPRVRTWPGLPPPGQDPRKRVFALCSAQGSRPGCRQSRPVPKWLGPAPAASFPHPSPSHPEPLKCSLRGFSSVSLHALYSPSRLQRRPACRDPGKEGEPAPDSPRCPLEIPG